MRAGKQVGVTGEHLQSLNQKRRPAPNKDLQISAQFLDLFCGALQTGVSSSFDWISKLGLGSEMKRSLKTEDLPAVKSIIEKKQDKDNSNFDNFTPKNELKLKACNTSVTGAQDVSKLVDDSRKDRNLDEVKSKDDASAVVVVDNSNDSYESADSSSLTFESIDSLCGEINCNVLNNRYQQCDEGKKIDVGKVVNNANNDSELLDPCILQIEGGKYINKDANNEGQQQVSRKLNTACDMLPPMQNSSQQHVLRNLSNDPSESMQYVDNYSKANKDVLSDEQNSKKSNMAMGRVNVSEGSNEFVGERSQMQLNGEEVKNKSLLTTSDVFDKINTKAELDSLTKKDIPIKLDPVVKNAISLAEVLTEKDHIGQANSKLSQQVEVLPPNEEKITTNQANSDNKQKAKLSDYLPNEQQFKRNGSNPSFGNLTQNGMFSAKAEFPRIIKPDYSPKGTADLSVHVKDIAGLSGAKTIVNAETAHTLISAKSNFVKNSIVTDRQPFMSGQYHGDGLAHGNELARVKADELIDKIQKIAGAGAQKTISTVTIRLDPPNLGSLVVKISHDGDELIARILPQAKEVEALLKSKTSEVISALSSCGFKSDNVHVIIASASTSDFGALFSGDTLTDGHFGSGDGNTRDAKYTANNDIPYSEIDKQDRPIISALDYHLSRQRAPEWVA